MKQTLAAFAGAAVLTAYGVEVLAQNQPAPPTPQQQQAITQMLAREAEFERNRARQAELAVAELQQQLAEANAKCAPKEKPATK